MRRYLTFALIIVLPYVVSGSSRTAQAAPQQSSTQAPIKRHVATLAS